MHPFLWMPLRDRKLLKGLFSARPSLYSENLRWLQFTAQERQVFFSSVFGKANANVGCALLGCRPSNQNISP